MDKKLLYSYPQKTDRATERAHIAESESNLKKAKKRMIISSLAGLLIIICAVIAPISWFRLVVAIVGVYSVAISYFGYRLTCQNSDCECYTKIYSDHIEHCQNEIFSLKKRLYIIEFSEILSCYENSLGGLVFNISENSRCKFVVKNKQEKSLLKIKNNNVTLYFQDFNTKMFLKVNLRKEVKLKPE